MDVIDIKLINHKCEVIGKKDGKDIKYSFELTNPRLLKYINLFLNKKKKLLKQAVDNMENDHFSKKLRHLIICYGIAGIVSIPILFFTLYATEIIAFLGFLGTSLIVLFTEIVRRTISYENDPVKEKIVNDLKDEVSSIEKTKGLVNQKIKEKDEREILIREEKLQKERDYYKNLRTELMKRANFKKMGLYFSKEELAIFNRLVYYSQRLGAGINGNYPMDRDEILISYFEKKIADPERSNLEILKEIEKTMFEKRYGYRNKKK